ncbi:MAG: hypothetical protein HXX17_06100 [Geobacteraceae bacterium]|nr:hypothetical protein [Geobacteraceae bacterium]
MKTKRVVKSRSPRADRQFVSPRQLMVRWRCSRSGVDQISAHAGLTRQNEKNALRSNSVSYMLSEVIAYEQTCMKRALAQV